MNNLTLGKILVLVFTGLFDVAGIFSAFYWGDTATGVMVTSMLGVLSATIVGVVKLWYEVDNVKSTLRAKGLLK